MATHTNEVSAETRAIFMDVRSIGKRVLERFYEGFEHALRDVHKGWKHLKPRERKIVFEKVQDVAKDLIVDKNDGGGADDGLALGTFHGYVCKVKRSLLYNVPLHVAERATNQDLQKAQQYAQDILKDSEGTHEDKMLVAYQWVKDEQIKEKERLKANADAKNQERKSSSSTETVFTLPDPDDYETNYDDSDALLQSGIQSILAWLQTKNLQLHLDKNLKSARALKHVLGELTAFENQQAKAEKAEKPELVAVG